MLNFTIALIMIPLPMIANEFGLAIGEFVLQI
jgi:hypothetical protein